MLSTAIGSFSPPGPALEAELEDELVELESGLSDPASSLLLGFGVPAAMASATAVPAAFATCSKVALSGSIGTLAEV